MNTTIFIYLFVSVSIESYRGLVQNTVRCTEYIFHKDTFRLSLHQVCEHRMYKQKMYKQNVQTDTSVCDGHYTYRNASNFACTLFRLSTLRSIQLVNIYYSFTLDFMCLSLRMAGLH